jgi:hypothetical protein
VPTKRESGSTNARMSALVLGGPPARTTERPRRRPHTLTILEEHGVAVLTPGRGRKESAALRPCAMDGQASGSAAGEQRLAYPFCPLCHDALSYLSKLSDYSDLGRVCLE